MIQAYFVLKLLLLLTDNVFGQSNQGPVLASKESESSDTPSSFSLSTMLPISQPSSSISPPPEPSNVLAGERVMAVLNSENSEDVDIDEEISKLLSTEAVQKDPEPDTFDVLGTLGTNVNDAKFVEKLDTLESEKVQEAELDDKLSIELKSIVQQIQDMQ